MSGALWELSAAELGRAYRSGQTTPEEAVGEIGTRIERLDPAIGAFRQTWLDRAADEAKARTVELERDEGRGVLHGIPVAIKELFDVEDAIGCYGSKVLRDRVAAADAEAVARLRAAGAIVVGITRSHEFGWGITTQHAELGSTRNPWNPERIPGGSSGGSAAAVATGMVPLALGSDTGGSIRIPAAFCGVAGLKPTYGRISKRGAVALAPTLDHPGPIARSLEDLALGVTAMAGHDPADPTTLRRPLPDIDFGFTDLRFGIAPDLHITPLAPDHEGLFQGLIGALENAGFSVREVTVPEAVDIRPAFDRTQLAEAYWFHTSTLGTFPDRAADYGSDVRRRLEMAADVTVADYLAAQEMRLIIRRRFETLFDEIDVLLTPVSAGGPSSVDRPDFALHRGEEIPLRKLVMDYTVPQDLVGIPSCALPIGLDEEDLPVAVQVSSAGQREDLALAGAAAVRSVTGEAVAWPPLAVEPSA